MVRIYLFLLFILTFIISIQAQQVTDTPKSGEGISSFLKRNNRPGKTYYKRFLELNRKCLNGKEELQLGVKYVLPPLKNGGKNVSIKKNVAVGGNDLRDGRQTASEQDSVKDNLLRGEVSEDTLFEEKTVADVVLQETTKEDTDVFEPSSLQTSRKRKGFVREPLFGKALADVRVSGKRLQGACFYVVGGHGGPDPGAIGKIGNVELHEDEYAYDVALRLARNLMEEGAEVRIIIQDSKDGIREDKYLSNSKRETCMGTAIPLNQVARLRQRCERINELYRKDRKKYKYCRAIFLHVDSRSKGAQTDVFFYHSPKSSLGRKLATTMKNTFESKYGKHQPNRGFSGTVSGRNLYVMLNTSPVSVFVELGNIQNAFDQRRFVISSNRQALAKWMMEGFMVDYKK
ncbi:N-acetylmuramoyl-L-alanine amidase [Bacteroides zoogleoformans]|uniref:N-acetylmuramoyl-L-alanine amidase n=1 Tax=Bacteroides zoogleoformans TaxID=28119 RepID=A0ABM6T4L9_9BACE|nr:N-acetylmuramoyl-L-alanine amidase [Bacteroides zoogleoformans]AVM51635.1 N-acetylmuramoyl-L-alanine amidase [Bacteroides zoogleoformans]TWJ16821.1 N-acetylmuramoyl-L-alanine amidase [Bacteroides zoogleoformans]